MTRTQTHRPAIATSSGVVLPEGGTIRSLADAPITSLHADADTAWALVGRRDVYRVRDDASELVARLDEPAGAVLTTHRGVVWVGGRQARLWRLDGDTLEVSSFQQAPTHQEWHTPWGGPP